MEINLNMYQTLAAAVAVFFLGGFLKTKIKLLRKYCIPAPVIGGTIFSILNCILYTQGIWTYTQDTMMQNWCMMLFFTSIGYLASVSLIKKGAFLSSRWRCWWAFSSSSRTSSAFPLPRFSVKIRSWDWRTAPFPW